MVYLAGECGVKGRAGKYRAGLRASTLRSAVSPSSGCSDPSVVGILSRLVGPPLGPASRIRSGLPLYAGLQLISASHARFDFYSVPAVGLLLLLWLPCCAGAPTSVCLPALW